MKKWLVALLTLGLAASAWADDRWPRNTTSVRDGPSSGANFIAHAAKNCSGLAGCFNDDAGTAIQDAVDAALEEACARADEQYVIVHPGIYTAGASWPNAPCSGAHTLTIACAVQARPWRIETGNSVDEAVGQACIVHLQDNNSDETAFTLNAASAAVAISGIAVHIDDTDVNGDNETGFSLNGSNIRVNMTESGCFGRRKNGSRCVVFDAAGTTAHLHIDKGDFRLGKQNDAADIQTSSVIHLSDFGTQATCNAHVSVTNSYFWIPSNSNGDTRDSIIQVGVAADAASGGCASTQDVSLVAFSGNTVHTDENNAPVALIQWYADTGAIRGLRVFNNSFIGPRPSVGTTDWSLIDTIGTGTAAHEATFYGNSGLEMFTGAASVYDTEQVITGRIDLEGDVNDTIRFCGVAPTGGTTNFLGPDNHDGSGSQFGEASCDARDNTTEATADVVLYQVDMRPHSMRCQLSAATTTDSLTLTLRDDTADYAGAGSAAMECTIAQGETICMDTNARLTPIAGGSAVAVEAAQSGTEVITADLLCVVEAAINDVP